MIKHFLICWKLLIKFVFVVPNGGGDVMLVALFQQRFQPVLKGLKIQFRFQKTTVTDDAELKSIESSSYCRFQRNTIRSTP